MQKNICFAIAIFLLLVGCAATSPETVQADRDRLKMAKQSSRCAIFFGVTADSNEDSDNAYKLHAQQTLKAAVPKLGGTISQEVEWAGELYRELQKAIENDKPDRNDGNLPFWVQQAKICSSFYVKHGEALKSLPQGAAGTALESRFRFAKLDLEPLLIGEWKGTLRMREPLLAGTPADPADTSDMPFRVVIERENARVFIENEGKQVEVLQGRLELLPIGPLGIISGFSYGTGDGKHPSWVESIVITLNLQSDDVLVAEWRRAVNNTLRTAKAQRAFSVAFSGPLHRTMSNNIGGKK